MYACLPLICMYACVCVCMYERLPPICMCVCVCVYVCMSVFFLFVCMHVCVYVCTSTFLLYACMHVCVYECITCVWATLSIWSWCHHNTCLRCAHAYITEFPMKCIHHTSHYPTQKSKHTSVRKNKSFHPEISSQD